MTGVTSWKQHKDESYKESERAVQSNCPQIRWGKKEGKKGGKPVGWLVFVCILIYFIWQDFHGRSSPKFSSYLGNRVIKYESNSLWRAEQKCDKTVTFQGDFFKCTTFKATINMNFLCGKRSLASSSAPEALSLTKSRLCVLIFSSAKQSQLIPFVQTNKCWLQVTSPHLYIQTVLPRINFMGK